MNKLAVAVILALAVAGFPARAAASSRGKSRAKAKPAPVFNTHFTTVVIDAGHGGIDRGGIPFQRITEKTMTLDVAKRLGKCLRKAGFQIVFTRTDDTFVSLGNRVAIANAQPNAIFVSIHFNAAIRAEAQGVETYFGAPVAASLAAQIHARVLEAASTDNRGIKQRGFYVLRNTTIPSVLVEPGFLTNPQQGAMILKPAFRQRLASLIAQAIIEKHSNY
jgi:N-acetylmuramoyl-L-alanine amidase